MDTKLQYPAQLNIDYPEKPLNRLSTLLRIIFILPIFIILLLLTNTGIRIGKTVINLGGILFFPTVLMLLFRKKYPRWWFNWNLEFMRFQYRVAAYLFLLRDEYPSTDEQQAVHLDLEYPDATQLNRGLPLIKWILAIPHFIIVLILALISLICAFIAWFAILFTGKYPRPLFNFVLGYMRWALRVSAYSLLLITDKYPPFSMK